MSQENLKWSDLIWQDCNLWFAKLFFIHIVDTYREKQLSIDVWEDSQRLVTMTPRWWCSRLAASTEALGPLPASDCRLLRSDKSLPRPLLCKQAGNLLPEQSTHYSLITGIGGPVCRDTHRVAVCTNTPGDHAGLFCFLLSTDVIVFLMVLEIITPCNVTRRRVVSSKPPPHGSSEVPHTLTGPSSLNDAISQKASAKASSCGRIWGTLHQQTNWLHTREVGQWV